MSRSIFRTLHQRYGVTATGAERRRRALGHLERTRATIPFEIQRAARPAVASPPTVAIVGAGFAGCAAAWLASVCGFKVTVFDAMSQAGGRVRSSSSIVPGRILEMGAELIGLNHPLWLLFANAAGLGLAVVTPEDEQGGGLLETPLLLKGRLYDREDQERLYAGMHTVFGSWVEQARVVTDPWEPWSTTNAPALDSQNPLQHIPAGTPQDVIDAISTEFELNNTIPISQQSWLAILAQISAGGGWGFFEDTEVFRCSAGNQALTKWLLDGVVLETQKTISAIEVSNSVTLRLAGGQRTGPFDYLIVAVSVAMWPQITVDGTGFPKAGIGSGPAIKYLAPVNTRFWIPQWLSPEGMSDVLGMTWEGTDNQNDTAGFDLTVFAGGNIAMNAIKNGGTDKYFKPLVSALHPGFATAGGTFVNWPGNPAVRTGYSCPQPGQVVNQQQSYQQPYKGRLFLAGEHTSPAWFGFMEGALESGVRAAIGAAAAAGLL